MPTTCDSHNSRQRSDLRALDNHEGWRGVYALLEVDQSIEPTTTTSDRGDVAEVNTQ